MAKPVTINIHIKDVELFSTVLEALHIACSALDEIEDERAKVALDEVKSKLQCADIEMEST